MSINLKIKICQEKRIFKVNSHNGVTSGMRKSSVQSKVMLLRGNSIKSAISDQLFQF